MTSRKSFHNSRSQTLFSEEEKQRPKYVCGSQARGKWVNETLGQATSLTTNNCTKALFALHVWQQIEFGICKKFENFVHNNNFLLLQPCSHLRRTTFLSIKVLSAKQDDLTKDTCQGTKEIVTWQKIVGLQIFSMASSNFGDSWENFGRLKKSFALEMTSCWQICLQNKQNFALCDQGLASRHKI